MYKRLRKEYNAFSLTSDALKTRKNRIKNKMDTQIFERVFGADNQ